MKYQYFAILFSASVSFSRCTNLISDEPSILSANWDSDANIMPHSTLKDLPGSAYEKIAENLDQNSLAAFRHSFLAARDHKQRTDPSGTVYKFYGNVLPEDLAALEAVKRDCGVGEHRVNEYEDRFYYFTFDIHPDCSVALLNLQNRQFPGRKTGFSNLGVVINPIFHIETVLLRFKQLLDYPSLDGTFVKHVLISGQEQISAEQMPTILSILKNWINVETIKVEAFSSNDDRLLDLIMQLMQNSKHLKSLNSRDRALNMRLLENGALVDQLGKSLEYLEMNVVDAMPIHISILAKLQNLKDLRLAYLNKDLIPLVYSAGSKLPILECIEMQLFGKESVIDLRLKEKKLFYDYEKADEMRFLEYITTSFGPDTFQHFELIFSEVFPEDNDMNSLKAFLLSMTAVKSMKLVDADRATFIELFDEDTYWFGKLESLTFFDKGISKRFLSRILRKMPNLQRFQAFNLFFKDLEKELLINALKKLKHLNSLNIEASRSFEDVGASLIAESIKSWNQLRSLSLNSCFITDKGISKIMKAILENNRELDFLDVSGNQLSEKILSDLKQCPMIKNLKTKYVINDNF